MIFADDIMLLSVGPVDQGRHVSTKFAASLAAWEVRHLFLAMSWMFEKFVLFNWSSRWDIENTNKIIQRFHRVVIKHLFSVTSRK